MTDTTYNLNQKESKRWQNVSPLIFINLTVGIYRTHLKFQPCRSGVLNETGFDFETGRQAAGVCVLPGFRVAWFSFEDIRDTGAGLFLYGRGRKMSLRGGAAGERRQ